MILFICDCGKSSTDLQCLAKTDFKYMTSYCSKAVQVDDSLLLTLTFPENLPDHRNHDFIHCDLVLEAPKGMKLFSHFLQLRISPVQDHSDRLHLYDLTPNNTRLTPVEGLFGALDRTKSQSDGSDAQVNDYRTRSNKMKVDYLGKPTKDSPGFRLLVSIIQDPTHSGQCPVKHYFCRVKRMCIPRQLCCDGNHNCGNSDDGDEEQCDRYNTATDLLAGYSLTRDIIVVTLLPLAVFIGFAVIVFLYAHRYIRDKIDKPIVPAVHFTPSKEGQVRISEDTENYAPPSYEDVLGVSKTSVQNKTYNSVPDRENFQEDADSRCRTQPSNKETAQSQKMKSGDFREHDLSTMTSSKDANIIDDNDRLHGLLPHATDDDGNKIDGQRKGEKGKTKVHSNESCL
ncbi:unnamed protein product [Candidula unifasciata]|uniref:CUB domain-containing protein n=1 Tax=Candidula unifasciata TaxID=100452 RepID=A0A8S3YXF6_9EUPU|nr:unnamed protein product [Candidula unifasciata]